jgi:hypothetical protein
MFVFCIFPLAFDVNRQAQVGVSYANELWDVVGDADVGGAVVAVRVGYGNRFIKVSNIKTMLSINEYNIGYKFSYLCSYSTHTHTHTHDRIALTSVIVPSIFGTRIFFTSTWHLSIVVDIIASHPTRDASERTQYSSPRSGDRTIVLGTLSSCHALRACVSYITWVAWCDVTRGDMVGDEVCENLDLDRKTFVTCTTVMVQCYVCSSSCM